MNGKLWINSLNGLFCAVTLVMALGASGCQITESGQNLPSPWYVGDDVQHHAPGSEFKLPREAAAMAAAEADATSR
jgi:hypothetical protein